MTAKPIRRIAALPLSLAIVGVALMALAALPPSDSEQAVAQAATAPLTADVDATTPTQD